MLLWSTKFWDAQEIEYTTHTAGSRKIFTTVIGNNLFSGFLGPFGGPTPRKNNNLAQGDSDLNKVIDLVIARSKEQGLEYLFFRLPPRNFYPLDSSNIESILLEKNFYLLHNDTNHTQSIIQGNILRFNRNRKRDYKYWSEKGASFISPSSNPLMAFDCLIENRKLRNLTTSVTYSQYLNLARAMGHIVQLHHLEGQNEILAAAITMELDQDIVYVFIWGDNPSLRRKEPSPLSYFYASLAEHFKERGFSTICLGVSSFKGVVDEPLFKFKTSLGFDTSLKPTYCFSVV
jgi:hypothetical protein